MLVRRVQAAWLHKLFGVYLISSLAVVVAGACCTAKAVLLGRLAAVFVEHALASPTRVGVQKIIIALTH